VASSFVKHTSCECGSSDARSVYENPDMVFCNACMKYDTKEGFTVAYDAGENIFKPSSRKGPSSSTPIQGDIIAIPSRGITEKTAKLWNIESDGTSIVYHYMKDGKSVAQHKRIVTDSGKEMPWVGKPASLYGQWLHPKGGKILTICEGEMDAASLHQIFDHKYAVVAIGGGVQGSPREIKKHLQYIESFDEVVFFFDNDEPGQEAVKKCCPLLSPGKAFMAKMVGYNDINEALCKGDKAAVTRAFWNKEEYKPDGLANLEEVAEKAKKEVTLGKDYPWSSMSKMTYGRQPGLIVYGAGSGTGKSSIITELVYQDVYQHQDPCVVFSFEESNDMTLKSLVGRDIGRRINLPGAELDERALDGLSDLGKSDNLFLYRTGSPSVYQDIEEHIQYLAIAKGISSVYIDHITALTASVDRDERKAIDRMMSGLMGLSKRLDLNIHIVSHLTAPTEGPQHNEGGKVRINQLRGSRSIEYYANLILGPSRNCLHADPFHRNITTVSCLKDRTSGQFTGEEFYLQYDSVKHQINEITQNDINQHETQETRF